MLGCRDQTAPPEPLRATSLEAVSPQPDTAVMGGTRILEVRAVDANGNGVPGVEVTWHTTQPGDVIQPAVDTTDAFGLSRVTLRVSLLAGAHGVMATTRDLLSRAFFIHVAPAPIVDLGLRPQQLSLISRQTAQIIATPMDSAGNFVPAPLRWVSTNNAVATVDSTGLVRARRPGTTTIYANATVPPFRIDSVIVQVRAAVAARIELWPDTAGFIVGDGLRVSAFAFDSAGRPIDAVDIAWTTSNPQMPLTGRQVFDDSSSVQVTASSPGITTVQARIGSVAASALVTAVTDPLVQAMAKGSSFCYAGITFGPSGQFYYVSNEGGSFGPEDTLAVVRTGRAAQSTWTRSAEFAECDRGSPLARNTISIDAAENLYVPAKSGIVSINGLTGATRWHAPIGAVRGNIAISAGGILVAHLRAEVVALDTRDGSVLWRHPNPPEDSEGGPVIDDARGVAYVAHWQRLTAIDLRSGATVWQLETTGVNNGDIAIANDGTLYLGANNEVYSVTPGGQRRNSAPVQGLVVRSPLIDAQGNVYVVTFDRIAYSFTAGLSPRWTASWPGGRFNWMGSPVVDAEGTLYFGNGSDVVAVRAGRILWFRPDVSAFIGMYWGFGFDNQFYAASIDTVYRFDTAGRDPQAQWPMTHRSPDRAARR